jgi:hypothetical protein
MYTDNTAPLPDSLSSLARSVTHQFVEFVLRITTFWNAAMTASQQSSQADYATQAYKQVIKPGDLPVVSFRVVEDDDEEPSAFERRTKSDKVQLNLQLLKSYGYNVSEEDFTLDDHYIRHVEPIEVELANQVEYDMDEQDREWLDVANEERHRAGLDRMSYELFEIVMDKLEKEWFDLASHLSVSNTGCMC